MPLVKARSSITCRLINYARLSYLALDSEYSKEPCYPPINDTSKAAIKQRKSAEWHEKIKSIGTVEEKLIAINMPKYYGWISTILKEGDVPYNSLPFIQFVTRTHLINTDSLPDYYTISKIKESVNSFIDVTKDSVKEALIYEVSQHRKNRCLYEQELRDEKTEENDFTKSVVAQINRAILTTLTPSQCPSSKYLKRAQVDPVPRIEAFWVVGGIDPPKNVKKSREALEHLKATVNDPVDRMFQYYGSPILQVRTDLPLGPIIPREDAVSCEYHIEPCTYQPNSFGYFPKEVRGTNVPGFWPGDPCEFGQVSFHARGHLLNRRLIVGTEDEIDALHCQGILASFGWLMPQACYQGFSTYNDLTYPLTTQVVITNGQMWSFYVYQLNTTLLHSTYSTKNPYANICWASPPMKLYDSVEDNEVIGFNDDVLKMLMAFYMNQPHERTGVNMKPYLGSTEKYVADIEDIERREWLEKNFKYLFTNRKMHKLPYEMYHWEKIYKVDHKTRPMDARRRPFETGENPKNRRLDDHVPEYIPKKFRNPEEKRVKHKKTYYP